MRLIYIDEAGTDANSSVSVVVGVIVHPDQQRTLLYDYLRILAEKYVPFAHREGFIFHAKEIFGGKASFFPQGSDGLEARIEVLKDLLLARAKIGFSIGIGFCSNHAVPELEKRRQIHLKHMVAYRQCLEACNTFLEHDARQEGAAEVLYEDHPDMKRFLRDVHRKAHAGEEQVDALLKTSKLSRISKSVYFAKKDDDAVLQISDVIAFAIRRFVEKRRFGKELIQALEYPDHQITDWFDAEKHAFGRLTLSSESINSHLNFSSAGFGNLTLDSN